MGALAVTLIIETRRYHSTAIDRWWKWIRLAALRHILQGGFVEHYYQGNRTVLDNLQIDNLLIMGSELSELGGFSCSGAR